MKSKIHEFIAFRRKGMSKTMKIMPVALVVLLLANCAQERVVQQLITPPLSKADVPFSDFSFRADAGKTISFPNGTSIEIDPGTLVDENGKEITGEVQFQYREIHDAVGTFLSGIPMGYDSGSVHNQLSTAGMFEMYAYAGNKPLRIKDGKSIRVNLANNQQGSEYNYYYFNKASGNWEYLSTPASAPSEAKAELAAKLAALTPEPEQPKEFNDDTPVIDINYDVDQFPELKEFADVMWKCSSEEAEGKAKEAFTRNWARVELKEADPANLQYLAVLSNSDEDKMTLPVTPVLKGKSLDKAMAIYQKKYSVYTAEATKREELLEASNQQGAFTRALAVNNFGIYNCDKLMSFNGMASVSVDVQVEGEGRPTQQCYLVMKDYNTVITFTPGSSTSFSYDPNARNLIVAILPGNVAAVYRPQDFDRLNPAIKSTQKVVLKKEKGIFSYKDALAMLNN